MRARRPAANHHNAFARSSLGQSFAAVSIVLVALGARMLRLDRRAASQPAVSDSPAPRD
ncbi:MAG: hypothetical protein HGA45_40265 [Chloroflexales bacterium]|nr:hypothetical protein [Chloroflexales bacterium]